MTITLDLDTDYGINTIQSDSHSSSIHFANSNADFSNKIFSHYSHLKFSKEAVVVAKQSSFGEKSNKVFMRCANVEGHVEGGITMHWGDKDGPSITAYTEIEIKDKGTSIGGSYERHDDGTSDLTIYGKSDFEVEFDD